MGFLRDLIAAKEEIWEGEDETLYEKNCEALKAAGYKIQAFKKNTDMQGCTGDCAGCSTCAELNIEARKEEPDKIEPDVYAIYVKQSDAETARAVLVG